MRREPGVGIGVLGPQVRQGARVVALPQPEVVVDAAVAVDGHVLGLARRDGRRRASSGQWSWRWREGRSGRRGTGRSWCAVRAAPPPVDEPAASARGRASSGFEAQSAVDDRRGARDGPTRTRFRLPRPARLGERGHQPHPVHELHQRGAAPPRARALLLPPALVLRRPRGRDPEPGRLPPERRRRALGDPGARPRRRRQRRRERLRPPRHELLPRARRQPARLHLPVPPVELLAQGRPAGRAVSSRRAPGRKDQRRHAGRLQARGERPQQAQGRDARRRRLRLVRPGRRAARGLPRPGGAALLRPPVRRPRAEDPRLQPAAHSGQLEADAGEHQGPLPPGPAAHLVRDLRPLARRQQVAARDGRAASPRAR